MLLYTKTLLHVDASQVHMHIKGDLWNMGSANMHQVCAMQVSSFQTGLSEHHNQSGHFNCNSSGIPSHAAKYHAICCQASRKQCVLDQAQALSVLMSLACDKSEP